MNKRQGPGAAFMAIVAVWCLVWGFLIAWLIIEAIQYLGRH